MFNLRLGKRVTLPLWRFGDHCTIGDDCIIKTDAIFTRGTVLGEGVFVGPQVVFLGDHFDKGDRRGPGKLGAVVGDAVQIGAGSKIDPGLRICSGTIIGANSYVRRDITAPGVYVGSPCRRIK